MRTRSSITVAACAAMVVSLLGSAPAGAATPFAAGAGPKAASAHKPTAAQVARKLGQAPLAFQPNQGQADSHVAFAASGPGPSVALTKNESMLSLGKGNQVLRTKLVGSNPNPMITGADPLATRSNYYVGSNPAGWHTNIPSYARVNYRSIYPGVDVAYYGTGSQLEYDFDLAPHADPARVQLAFGGARKVRLDHGDLVVTLVGGDVRQGRPHAYQDGPGGRRSVTVGYVFHGQQIGFRVGSYDHSRPLVIDPIVYSQLFAQSVPLGISVDSAGDAYVTGQSSINPDAFPIVGLPPPKGPLGGTFFLKLTPSGTLVFSDFLGGGNGAAIAVDAAGHAYLTGNSAGTDFPTTKGAYDTDRLFSDGVSTSGSTAYTSAVAKFQPTDFLRQITGTNIPDGTIIANVDSSTTVELSNPATASGTGLGFTVHGGHSGFDGFVTKLNLDGTIAYSTYLGPTSFGSESIAIDSAGDAYVAGSTEAPGNPPAMFPVVNALQATSNAPDYTGYLSKLDPTGSTLLYSTLLGGSGDARATGVAVDNFGNAYVAGSTDPAGFPTTSSAFRATISSPGPHAFLAKLDTNAAGAASLKYSSLFGGNGVEALTDPNVAADGTGHAWITGTTTSTDFPTTPGAFDTLSDNKQQDFVAKFDTNAAGAASVLYSTYLGDGLNGGGSQNGIAVDSAGNAYVVGGTVSPVFPLVNPVDGTFKGTQTIFVTEVNVAGNGLVFSTYLGGTDTVGHEGNDQAVAVDARGNIYVTGQTGANDFPAPPGLPSPVNNGNNSGFVVKISPVAPTVTGITPLSGPASGGTQVTITGTGFATTPGATTVSFGGVAATGVFCSSVTTCVATSPAGAGVQDVTVTVAGQASAATAVDKFTYVAAPVGPTVSGVAPMSGPAAGGTQVTITGTGFNPAPGTTTVSFGGTAGTGVSCSTTTTCVATSPPGTSAVDVTVTVAGQTSPPSAADRFTYQPAQPAGPAVTGIAPASGPAAGGTPVTITGTGFATAVGATTVSFGGTAGTAVSCSSATTCVATSPPGTGVVDVVVTVAGQTSPASAADKFTYQVAPTVTGVAPSSGPAAGGTTVTVTGTGFATAAGATTVAFGAAAATGVSCSSATSCVATSPAGTGTVDVSVTVAGQASPASAADKFTYAVARATGGAYTPLAPTRVADTRPGSGEANAGQTLSPGGTVTVNVGSQVPSTATAVALSVTAVDGTRPGFLAVYPGGSASGATESVLNFAAGDKNCTVANCVVPNLVITKVTGGQVTIKNTNINGGTVDAVVDLEGYFDPSTATTSGAGHYRPAAVPARVVDTRCGEIPPASGATRAQCNAENLLTANAAQATVAAGGTLHVATGLSGASAVVVELTATNTTANGYLTAYGGTGSRPNASNVNFVKGQTAATRAIVPVGADGSINVFNYAGSADVIVDVVGSFSDATGSATAGTLFTPIDPSRILDTRTSTPIGPNGSLPVSIAGMMGIPAEVNGQPTAAALNVTEATATHDGFLTVTPNPIVPPATTSDVNFGAGQTRANADLATLNTGGGISIYNYVGNTDVLVDAFGYFSAAGP